MASDGWERRGIKGSGLSAGLVKTGLGTALLGIALVGGCRDGDDDDDSGDDGTGTDETDGGDPTGDGDTGEVPDNGIPLELELARFNATGKFLLLRFSEPLAPIDGVDPSDFRISLALSVRYAYGPDVYASSNYFDPNFYLAPGYYGGGYEYLPMTVDLVVPGNMPTDLLLRFANPMTPQGCEGYAALESWLAELDTQPEYQTKVGLFPHYSPGAVPVRSADGEVLAAIGADWVETFGPDMYTEIWGWPDLDPEIPIPCDVSMVAP